MMNWNSVIGALVIGAGLCNPSYGFEWLDRLIGIDLDNSQGQGYGSYYSGYAPYDSGYPSSASTYGYAPYTTGYSSPASTTGYAPYSAGYAAPAGNGCSTCAPSCGCAPQTSYRTVYQPVPVTSYQPVTACGPCGNQVTTLRPVVTYRMQPQVVPYTSSW